MLSKLQTKLQKAITNIKSEGYNKIAKIADNTYRISAGYDVYWCIDESPSERKVSAIQDVIHDMDHRIDQAKLKYKRAVKCINNRK